MAGRRTRLLTSWHGGRREKDPPPKAIKVMNPPMDSPDGSWRPHNPSLPHIEDLLNRAPLRIKTLWVFRDIYKSNHKTWCPIFLKTVSNILLFPVFSIRRVNMASVYPGWNQSLNFVLRWWILNMPSQYKNKLWVYEFRGIIWNLYAKNKFIYVREQNN